MSEIKMGPWPLGIDMISNELRLPTDDRGRLIAVRDAVNVDFDEAGQASRRPGADRLDMTPVHSAFSCDLGTFCMIERTLNRVHIGTSSVTYQPLDDLASSEPVSYDMLNGNVVYSNTRTIGLITPGGLRPLGVEEPSAFTLEAVEAGGLYAGRYSVAITQLAPDGEESAASALATVNVLGGGGLRLSGLAHQLPLRVYRTGVNGDVLYRCADIPVGMPAFLVGAGPAGRACKTRHLSRTPPGRIVRYWMGRLLIVRGRTMYFTDPMGYGLVDPRRSFIQFAKLPTMVRPVDAGIFVGTSEGVRFYRGTSPDQLVEEMTGGKPPIPGADAEIDSSILTGDASDGTKSAVWLAENGFVRGTRGGQIIEPHAKRIRLTASSGSIAAIGRRLIAIVN